MFAGGATRPSSPFGQSPNGSPPLPAALLSRWSLDAVLRPPRHSSEPCWLLACLGLWLGGKVVVGSAHCFARAALRFAGAGVRHIASLVRGMGGTSALPRMLSVSELATGHAQDFVLLDQEWSAVCTGAGGLQKGGRLASIVGPVGSDDQRWNPRFANQALVLALTGNFESAEPRRAPFARPLCAPVPSDLSYHPPCDFSARGRPCVGAGFRLQKGRPALVRGGGASLGLLYLVHCVS